MKLSAYQLQKRDNVIYIEVSLYKEYMGRNILSQFPNLCGNDVTKNERLKYSSHLHRRVEDMHVVCLWLPLLFLGMEVRRERQFRFMPST